jgi:glycosyltransferase involved in cell wall biosynthesis
MRILFMISRSPYDSYMGGAENFVKSVGERLAKRHDVHVLTRKVSKNLPDEETKDGVHLHRYSFLDIPKIRYFTDPSALYKSGMAIVKKYDIDVIVPCMLHPTGIVGVKIAKRTGIPSLLSLQNKIFKENLQGYSGRLSRFALNNATRIHVISKFMENNLLEYIDRLRKDIVVIHDGVDTGFFNPRKVKLRLVRKKYPQGNPVICFIAHFKFPQKRQDMLVRSIEKVREKYPGVRLLLAGFGDSSHVKSWVEKLGLSENVSFLGYQPPERVREIMALSDIFAFITSFEGMGIVAVESLAMGTPVVATDVGPLPEMVRDGVDGKLVRLDVDSIANGILWTLSNKKIMTQRRGGIEWVRKNFSWDIISKKIESELVSLIRKGGE